MIELQRLWSVRLASDMEHIFYTYGLNIYREPTIEIRELEGRWGSYDPIANQLEISTKLIREYPWHVVIEVLKHELAHFLVHYFDVSDTTDHGEAFRKMCIRLQTSSWASASDATLRAIPDWRAGESGDDETSRLMRKVEKLMALAASDNEHEAFLAMERVRELYLRYNLEGALGKQGQNFIYHVIQTGKKRVQREQKRIFSILNSHYFVKVLSYSSFIAATGDTEQVYELMGTRHNVLMAEYVYHFLMDQLPKMWKHYKKTNKLVGDGKKRSFFIGVLKGFDDRLDQQAQSLKEKTVRHYVDEKALVSLDSGLQAMHKAERELDAFMRKRHPKMITTTQSHVSIDAKAYHAGKDEGSRLTVHRPVSSGHSGAMRYLPS